MALLSLLFGTQKGTAIKVSKTLGALGTVLGVPQTLTIDAALKITHDSEANPTEHPVEEGSKISDHIQVETPTVTIEGIITDSPLGLLSIAAGALTSGARAVALKQAGGLGAAAGALVGGSIGSLLNTSSNKVRDSYLLLRELQIQRVTFTLITSLQTYSNMVLQKLSVPQEPEWGNALKFTITLKQIRLAASFKKQVIDGTVEASAVDAATNITEGGKQVVDPRAFNQQVADLGENVDTIQKESRGK